MLKKFYKIIIVPYTLFLLYLMFLGWAGLSMKTTRSLWNLFYPL